MFQLTQGCANITCATDSECAATQSCSATDACRRCSPSCYLSSERTASFLTLEKVFGRQCSEPEVMARSPRCRPCLRLPHSGQGSQQVPDLSRLKDITLPDSVSSVRRRENVPHHEVSESELHGLSIADVDAAP